MKPPLYHGLYTNAFGRRSGGAREHDRRGEGFRHIFLAPAWTARDRQRIGSWMQGLRPLDEAGVAVNCFRIGRRVHAALARIDADFARDEHGRRGGLLVHVLLLPLDEGRPPGSFTRALLDRGRGLVRPQVDDADRLEAYLEQCRAASDVDLSPADPAEIATVEAGFAASVATVAARSGRREEVGLPASSEDELTDRLATVVGWLPPRLRLACRWAVGLRPTSDMSFVARPTSDVPSSAGPGAALESWWRRCLASGRTGDIVALANDWDVRSWDMLMGRLQSGPGSTVPT